jgi:hypothetical protein
MRRRIKAAVGTAPGLSLDSGLWAHRRRIWTAGGQKGKRACVGERRNEQAGLNLQAKIRSRVEKRAPPAPLGMLVSPM